MSQSLRERIEGLTKWKPNAIGGMFHSANGTFLELSAVLRIITEHDRDQAAPVVDMTPGGSCPDFRPQQLADLSARDHEQVNRHAKDIGCRAGTDGDCYWSDCPQIGDGEPKKSGRNCPLWDTSDRET